MLPCCMYRIVAGLLSPFRHCSRFSFDKDRSFSFRRKTLSRQPSCIWTIYVASVTTLNMFLIFLTIKRCETRKRFFMISCNSEAKYFSCWVEWDLSPTHMFTCQSVLLVFYQYHQMRRIHPQIQDRQLCGNKMCASEYMWCGGCSAMCLCAIIHSVRYLIRNVLLNVAPPICVHTSF